MKVKNAFKPAIKNAGLKFPNHKITINLAPASVRKVGPVYDLPIAIATLAASNQIPLQKNRKCLARRRAFFRWARSSYQRSPPHDGSC